MSKNIEADAQDSAPATEEILPAVETQPNPQGDEAPASADGDDYLADREKFLSDEAGFLKESEEKPEIGDLKPEKTPEPEADAAETGKPEVKPEEVKPEEEKPEPEADAADNGTTPKRKHVNLARMGEDKAKLVLFLDQNPGVPLEKAMEILKLAGGEVKPDDGLPKTSADAQARADELFEQGLKAQTDDLDFNRGADLLRESRKLEKLAGELRGDEMQVRSQENQRINGEFEDSKRNAVKYYPDAAKADTPLVKKMLELDDLLKETGDERFHSADKPFLLAKLAAKELGIAPKNPSSAPAEAVKPQSSPSAPSKVPSSPVQPARGNARTQQTNTREGTLEEVVDNIRDEDSYEAAKKAVLKVA